MSHPLLWHKINNAGDTYEIRKGNNFVDANYSVGDIVINTTDGTSSLINRIGDYRTARIDTAIMAIGEFFTTYQHNNGGPNLGCILYVGVTGDIRVLTASGQDIVYKDVPQGIWMPIQVTKVFETDTVATDIVAQW